MKSVILLCCMLLYSIPQSGGQLFTQYSDQLNDYLWRSIHETFAEVQFNDASKARDTWINLGGLIMPYNWDQIDSESDVPITTDAKIVNLDRQPHNNDKRVYDAYSLMVRNALKKVEYPADEFRKLEADLKEAIDDLIDWENQCDEKWEELKDSGNFESKEELCGLLGFGLWIEEIKKRIQWINAQIKELLDEPYIKFVQDLQAYEDGMYETKIVDEYGNIQSRTFPNWITSPTSYDAKNIIKWSSTRRCIDKRVSVDEQFLAASDEISNGTGLNFFVTYVDGHYRTVELDNTLEAEFHLCFNEHLVVTVSPDGWYDILWLEKLEKDISVLEDNWSICEEEDKDFHIIGEGGVLNSIIKQFLVVSSMEFNMTVDASFFQKLESFNPDDFRIANICKGRSCFTNGNVLIGFDISPSIGSYIPETNQVTHGWLYMQHALSDLLRATTRLSSTPNMIAVLGAPALSDPTELSGTGSSTAITAVAHVLGLNLTFYDGQNGIRNFFNDLALHNEDPQAIWIPHDIDQGEIDVLATGINVQQLNLFAASGGGIMTHGSPNSHKWLFELLPYAQYDTSCNRAESAITGLGHEWFNSITSDDVTGTCTGHLKRTGGSCTGYLDMVAEDGNGNAFVFTSHGQITSGRECGVFPAPTPIPTPPPTTDPTAAPTAPPTAVPTAVPTPMGWIEPCTGGTCPKDCKAGTIDQNGDTESICECVDACGCDGRGWCILPCEVESDDWDIVKRNYAECNDVNFECPEGLELWKVESCCGCRPRACTMFELTGREGSDAFVNGIYVEHEMLNGKMSYYNSNGNGLYLFWYDIQDFWLLTAKLGELEVYGYATGGFFDVRDAVWMMADVVTQTFVEDPDMAIKCINEWCDINLSGVHGCDMDFNGEFIVQPELFNGRPLYKLAGEDVYMCTHGLSNWAIVQEDISSEEFLVNAVVVAIVTDNALSVERIQNDWLCYKNEQDVEIDPDITCRSDATPIPTDPPQCPQRSVLDFPGINGANALINGVYVPTDQLNDDETVYYNEVNNLYLYFLRLYGFWLLSNDVGSTQTYGYCDTHDILTCTWHVAENSVWKKYDEMSARCAEWCSIVVSNCIGCSDINGHYAFQSEIHNGRPSYYSRSSQYYLYFVPSSTASGWYISENLGQTKDVRAKVANDTNSPDRVTNVWLVLSENNEYEPSALDAKCTGPRVLLELSPTTRKRSERTLLSNETPDHPTLLLPIPDGRVLEASPITRRQSGKTYRLMANPENVRLLLQVEGQEDQDAPQNDIITTASNITHTISVYVSSEEPIIFAVYAPRFQSSACSDNNQKINDEKGDLLNNARVASVNFAALVLIGTVLVQTLVW